MLLYSFLRDIEDIDITTVYDVDPERCSFFSELFEVPPAASMQEILNDKSVKGVLIVTGNRTHYPLADECLNAGKDIFVEKPVAVKLEEAQAMIKLAEDQQRILMVGHNSRRYPAVRKMKSLVDNKVPGEIKTVEATFSYYNIEEICADSWRNCALSCPGGPLMQLGIHHADNLSYLFGPVERISAEIMGCPNQSAVPAGGRMLLKFKNGIIGTITADYTTAPELFSIYARGAEGEIRVDGEDKLTVTGLDGKSISEIVEGTHSVKEELTEFCRCIENRQKPETDGFTGMQALNIILTGLEAARLGKALPLIRHGDGSLDA